MIHLTLMFYLSKQIYTSDEIYSLKATGALKRTLMTNILKMIFKYIIVILISFVLVCCNNITQSKIDKDDIDIELNPFIGEWISVKKIIPYSATLIIFEDGSFSFKYGACLARGFSKGLWHMKQDSLFLLSQNIDSCYYVKNFGLNCVLVPDSDDDPIEIQTTIEDCKPNHDEEYVTFINEEFIIQNDTLVHISDQNSICLEMKDKFVKNTNTNKKENIR